MYTAFQFFKFFLFLFCTFEVILRDLEILLDSSSIIRQNKNTVKLV